MRVSRRSPRALLKVALARLQVPSAPQGMTLLIYHRVGGGTRDELDVDVATFSRQMRLLAKHVVLSIDEALDRLDAHDSRPSFVITFDDGFEDVYVHAWPLLKELHLPFTIYLSSGFISTEMVWEGSTASGAPGRGMSWDQLAEMVASGLCTVGNHTHRHVRPEHLTIAELDECNAEIERHLGVRARHFTYPWGVPVPEMVASLNCRFRSASTGVIGRNDPGADRMGLRRVPVRRTDPDEFFAAKLVGALGPERHYGRIVRVVKATAGRFVLARTGLTGG